MKVRDVVVKYLDEARIMQVATCVDNQPWACTVYFAVDNLHNLYWISLPTRRHSEEIRSNPRVAGVIVKPHNYGDKVRGLQFQGEAREVTAAAEVHALAEAYMERYTRSGLAEEIITGSNPHHLYQIKPTAFVLFDEVNFPEQPRQDWSLS